jgi:hypothetical protein
MMDGRLVFKLVFLNVLVIMLLVQENFTFDFFWAAGFCDK